MMILQLVTALVLLAFSQLVGSADTLLYGKNITEGQSLISSQDIFELGFFNPPGSAAGNYYLGIWYIVSPDVVVWVANRDHPLNNTPGILTIHNNGSLVLYDSFERILWSSSTNSTSSANYSSPVVHLNDLGNLILKDQISNTTIWQSFDYPTNNLLSGMKLGKNLTTGFETVLCSWKSSTDPSKGMYTTKMDTEGDPEIVTWVGDQIMFKTGRWNGLYFSNLAQSSKYTNLVTYYFVWDKDEVSYEFVSNSMSTLSRVYLNEVGLWQRMFWNQDQKNWTLYWSGPNDECDYYAKCGDFSICQPNSLTDCSCLRGFQVAIPDEWNVSIYSGGCKRKTPLGCRAHSDGFYELKGVKVPDSHNATVDVNLTIDECRTRCLMNCSCLAYAPYDIRGGGSGCVMWDTALVDIKYVNGGEDMFYVKVSKSELGASNRKKLAVLAGTITAALILLLLICLVGYLFRWKGKRFFKPDKLMKFVEQNDSFHGADLPVYDIKMILQATDNFLISNIVGEGGFGTVYKGKLLGDHGQAIAVKRLSKNSSQGSNEFMNEVTLIAKLQHRNLVKLLGCCIDNNERILVYEFMPNKSLDFFIFDPEKRASLSWTTKFEIIIGIARGLLYLHHDSRFNVIHRDLKAANVLLDEEMCPKIADFGTARLIERGQAVLSTEIVIGTRGYMSPEYVAEGSFSVKSDVYSFGVIVLEILSGKRNQGNQNLISYAWKLWEEQNILELLPESVGSSVATAELLRSMHVGLLCVQERPHDRPSMSSVVTMLSSENLELPAPKKPSVSKSLEVVTSGNHFSDYDSRSVDRLTITCIEGR